MKETTDIQTEEEEKKKKKKRRFIIIFIILFILAALIAVSFFLMRDSWYDFGAQKGTYEGKSQEEIIADLNRQVQEGMMNISIAATITFTDGNAEGEARIENIEGNYRDQKVKITLNDTDEVVYESGAIPPGSYIQRIKLSKDLDPGTYNATATFTGYDVETHEERGKAAAEIRLVVLG